MASRGSTIRCSSVGRVPIDCDVPKLVRSLQPRPNIEDCIERALAVARATSKVPGTARAAMSMARLRRNQGKPQQARELLARVYGWFTEGFDTLDLKEAKALLDELHA